MLRTFFARIPVLFAIVAVALLAAACGGGGGDATSTTSASNSGVGSGGTGIGVVSGFGSLIVDGVHHDDAMASYMSEEDQGAAVALAPTAAMLGHSVEYAYDAGGAMTTAMISPELVGSVSAVGSGSITVLGTSVTINSDTTQGPPTALVGYATPAAIQVGDRVAVYGLPKTNAQGVGYIQATLIVQKSAASGVRLTGYVSQYNAAAGSFAIGSNTVTIGQATLRPAGAALANGALVTVWSNSAPVANIIAADAIRIKWPQSASGNLTLSGPISAYVGLSNFKLRNVTVDAGSATIAPAGASLGDGKYVVVNGSFDAATGKLNATSVTVYAPAANAAIELHGTVLNFVSSASFTVRGVVVDASAATFSGGNAAQLANGVFVVVTGAMDNNVVRAASVAIVALDPAHAPANAMLDVAGTITSFDPATHAYSMVMASGASVSGTMAASMFYNNGSATDFAAGRPVTVRGMLNGGMLATSVVSFTQAATSSDIETPPTPGAAAAVPTYMEGIAYNVTATTFMLNGLTIQRNGLAVQGGGMMGAAMMSGLRFGVRVQFTGGQYVATVITRLAG